MGRGEPGAWCCAYTRPGLETFAAGSIEKETGFTTYLPRIAREQVVDGAVTRRWESLFPRYLFVRLDLAREGWQRAAWARGVQRLLGPPGRRPYVVPDLFMESLFARCGERAEIVERAETPRLIVSGDFVKVSKGPYSSFTGICRMTRKQRVSLLLEVFGRPTEVEFDISQVELVA